MAGIGLGRLLGGKHVSTPQSGVEAPRLLKRSLPDCIIVVVVFDGIFQAECQCQHVATVSSCRRPRWQRTLRHRGLGNWRSTPADLEKLEKWQKKVT